MSKNKIPLWDGAAIVTRMMEAIDDGKEISDLVQKEFELNMDDVSDGVDRRILAMGYMKDAIETTGKRVEEWREYKMRLTKSLEALKENTKNILTEFPDLPYKGQQGRLGISKSKPKLVVRDESEIPGIYFNEVVERKLNKELILIEIQDNGKSDYGYLEPVTALRIYKK